MIRNSVLEDHVRSKKCGKISAGGKPLAEFDEVRDFIHNNCFGFITTSQ
jgi:hypothetical protein